jgi:dihydrolipoamide dehydrogenase
VTTSKTHTSDVVVLGGGSAGYACALRASQLGLSVTLIEEEKIGGTCLHQGCIPTKALLHAAEVAETVRVSEMFGVRASLNGIDLDAVYDYRDGVVNRLFLGLMELVRQRGITVIEGRGKYAGDRSVEVNGTRCNGEFLVLATGASPRVPTAFETGARVLTSDDALNLPFIPRSALIMGGGVIGVEFASLWATLGAEVTVVESLSHLLASEDPWCSRQIERAFIKRGITVRTNTTVESVEGTEGGLQARFGDGEQIDAEVLLIAVGRRPRTADIGLAEHGVALDDGFIRTDDGLRTNVAGVFAAGDIVRGPQLAHRGFQHGMFLAEQFAGLNPTPLPDDLIPRVVYSQPEVASVGLSEDAARQRYRHATSTTYDLAGNGRSQILRTSGAIKVVAAGEKSDQNPIVGVHFVGDRVSELTGEALLAVAWEALPSEVAQFVHAHPTQNEALAEAMLSLSGKPLHAHGSA